LSEEASASKFLCRKGDIIFGRRRAYLRKLAISDGEYLVSTDAMIFRPKDTNIIYPNFIPFLLQSEDFWSTVISLSEGSMSPRVKWKTMATQEFFIPTMQEQKRISIILWAIEDNLRTLEELIQFVDKLKKNILETLMTRGIQHTKFKETEFGRMPEDWQIGTLGETATIKARIGWRGLKSGEYTSEGPYLIAATHIIDSEINWNACDHLSDFRYDESPEIQLQNDDIILSKDGTIGRVAHIDKLPGKATINGTMMLIRPNVNIFESRFVFYYLQADSFQNLVKDRLAGSTIPHIFLRDIRNLHIPIIPKEEQQEIIRLCDQIVDLRKNLSRHLTYTKDLKKAVLNKLLSVELAIPEMIKE
jgi:type I restriction enzyme S subunit